MNQKNMKKIADQSKTWKVWSLCFRFKYNMRHWQWHNRDTIRYDQSLSGVPKTKSTLSPNLSRYLFVGGYIYCLSLVSFTFVKLINVCYSCFVYGKASKTGIILFVFLFHSTFAVILSLWLPCEVIDDLSFLKKKANITIPF